MSGLNSKTFSTCHKEQKCQRPYRNKRHLPLKDRCPYKLVILMKRPNNQSKLRWDLNSSHLLGGQTLASFPKERRLRNHLSNLASNSINLISKGCQPSTGRPRALLSTPLPSRPHTTDSRSRACGWLLLLAGPRQHQPLI
jgi:hypothetical protein